MLPYFALLISFLLLCCGLAVDVGLMQIKKLQMQSAADAAAIGAELEQERGTWDNTQNTNGYVLSGIADASANGYTNGVNNTTVTSTARFQTGILAGHHDGVQVTISQPATGVFTRLLNGSTVTVTATALQPPCVMLTGSKALTRYQLSVTSGAGVYANHCPFYVNGSLDVENSPAFYTLETMVTGIQGNSIWNPSDSFWPPRYADPVLPDPLSSLTQPSSGGCMVNNYTQSSVSSNQSAPPGTYCGNSSYACSNSNVVISLSPGLYVFAGGLSISNCTITGTGVTLFFTRNPNNGTYGKLLLSNSNIYLSAPTVSSNGSIAGLLFMTDRSWVPSTAQDFVLDTCYLSASGIWYLTNAGLALKSSSFNTNNYQALLAENLLLTNTAINLNSDYTSVNGGNPLRRSGTLAE